MSKIDFSEKIKTQEKSKDIFFDIRHIFIID